MKKLLAVTFAALMLLSGCRNTNVNSSQAESAPEPALSSAESSAPVADSKLSESLSKMMKDSFGTTSWYPYIQEIEVFTNSGINFATINVTETPLDYSARLLLSTKATQSTIDTIVPVALNTASALKLNDMDAALISEALVKILDGNSDVQTTYNSLYAYKIPVFKYLADYTNTSESDVKANLKSCVGNTAVSVLLAGMTTDYGDSFSGFNMESAKRIAMTANVNFKDVSLDYVVIQSPDGTQLEKYDAVK